MSGRAARVIDEVWEGRSLEDSHDAVEGATKVRLIDDDRRYRLMVEAIQDYAVFLLDPDGCVVSWNAGAERIKGYRSEEILGRHFSCFYSPQDLALDLAGRELKSAATEGRVECEGWRLRKDASSFLASSVMTAILDDSGRLQGFCRITRDLTDRNRAEETLRSVVDHVLDGIVTTDERGIILSFNPAAERIFGYTAAGVVGKNVSILMPEPYKKEHDCYVERYLTTGRPKIIGRGREVVGQRSDGSSFPMDLAVSEFHLNERRYFTGIIRDITERKRLEQELHERLDQLAEKDRCKDEFLAMLAHELRNPLAAIDGAVQLATIPDLHEQTDFCIGVIARQTKKLTRLIDDLLDVSRITRGKIHLHLERVDLAEVLRGAVDAARPLIEDRGLVLTLVTPSGDLLTVDADPMRLEQIVTNLLTNAGKYTDSGGRIEVSAARDGAEILVRVRDTGIGMRPELIDRMFELFAQGDRSPARSEGGLGIGLTLSRSLAEMHGGRLTATSDGPGTGSEFVVRLPAAPPSTIEAEVPGSILESGQARSILIVDDNVDLAQSLARLLRLFGHEVVVAFDGHSGLAAARRHQPEVILLDIGLPGMDGFEVAEQLRGEACGSGALLIAVTGYGQDENRQRARLVGFDHYLTKPVGYRTLLALMAEPSPAFP